MLTVPGKVLVDFLILYGSILTPSKMMERNNKAMRHHEIQSIVNDNRMIINEQIIT